MYKIIARRKIWYILSLLVLIPGIACLILWKLNLGLDFTGGTLINLGFKSRPSITEVKNDLAPLSIKIASIQPAGENDMFIRMETIPNEKRIEILDTLKAKYGEVEEKRFESIGPTVGAELRRKAIIATSAVLICIILYITYAFRKVSKEVSSWKMGVCTILALIHDLLVVVGIFSLLGKFRGVEIDSLFITALLTVLGYSIHDTIVVFDRIRFNLIKNSSLSFEENMNNSLNQTMTRSINITVTTLLVLFALYFFGGDSIKWFVVALIIGLISGTYSSIFIASPLLIDWQKRSKGH
jgi:preprotein translocase subunit SecF